MISRFPLLLFNLIDTGMMWVADNPIFTLLLLKKNPAIFATLI